MQTSINAFLADSHATEAFGVKIASIAKAGLLLFLQGDLGAGKTTLTRAMLQALGVQGRIKSPTYSLLESYSCNDLTIHHFDLYRMASPYEWEEAGFRELLSPHNLIIIEWAEKAAACLPMPDLLITLTSQEEGRTLTLTAQTPQGVLCLTQLNMK